MDTKTEFETWLHFHQEKFKSYTIDEVAKLAIACGFGRLEVNDWIYRARTKSTLQ